ncbi:hypothetical protein [Nocardioides kribbensis]|uniref:hypothetical protein n=1 Tax=Nocardioides kribbensis TaxID=305517 RepID=UPI00187AEA19|nr:hypothetical protein [Nocardioides kribbensis]
MKKALLVVATVVVVVLVGGGAWAMLGGGTDLQTRGTCGNATYELSAEDDDDNLEVNFELQSASAGEAWEVVVAQDGTALFSGERTTDEDAELDVDVLGDEDADAVFSVVATPQGGEACTVDLD